MGQSFSGALIIQDSLSFPYYLKLDQQSFSGFSVSDINGDTETLSLVELNQSEGIKGFEIEESQVVYTKLKSTSYDDFCKIIFKMGLNSKSIDKEFIAMTSDKTSCGKGIVKLENVKKLSKKLNKIKTKIEDNKALKTLTNQSDRQISVKKIEQLLQLSVLDYSTQININPQDFFDFIFFKNDTRVTLVFEDKISENWKNFINMKNGTIKENGNSIELIKTQGNSRSEIIFSNEYSLTNNSFVVKINDELSLRFLFPDNFERATFVF